ncbi:TrbC/VirB2 family protein [Fictibacillus enclensis]|uniref:TrbC/VirB2 family protein n=1 Tax=Fictibacillus enclensis TaxID=1017270 RepID=UPI0025A1FCB6|nr:TrbC/VirB2 family protein [Fictibacillus enclensis]MDM5335785.1 TrbC/VirB2 family protein [Fictibacillus enclensis]
MGSFIQSITNVTYNDFFSNVGSSVTSFTGKLQGLALGVIICCIVITGFMFLFGEGPSRTAKKWLVYVVIGAVLIFGAATLGSTIQDVSGF